MLDCDGKQELAEHNGAPATLSLVRISVSERQVASLAQHYLTAPAQHQLSGVT